MFARRRPTLVTVDLRSAAGVAAAWRSRLTKEEAARIDRFRRVQDQISYAAAHCLKRLLLARVTGLDGASIEIVTEPSGKPVLRDRRDIHFNLSHTDGMVAVAVSTEIPLGVDVEALGRHEADAELVEAALGPAASVALLSLPRQKRELRFHTSWTAREAVTKADGRALALSRQELKFRGEVGEVLAPNGRRWNIVWPHVGHRHVAALAMPVPLPVYHRHIGASDLVRWAKLATS